MRNQAVEILQKEVCFQENTLKESKKHLHNLDDRRDKCLMEIASIESKLDDYKMAIILIKK